MRTSERCSPRFRPEGRFCELRFKYQSSPTENLGSRRTGGKRRQEVGWVRMHRVCGCADLRGGVLSTPRRARDVVGGSSERGGLIQGNDTE